ncbi:MAG: hypothetical protein RIB03_01130 [Henriciella sp.]|uniref:hypothetical protein n=1 Tax=Henriciella sp. TaxID=1968823 RepID=UPI00262576B0|nr:hypothetical protein [Henriciella sp.]
MTPLIRSLTTLPVIIGSFILMVVIGMSFAPVQSAIDGPLLDMIWTGDAARARLNEMTEVQKTAHFWGTILNDTAYPLAYGAFFAGLAGRFAPPRVTGLVMLPALMTVIADLAENTVQALALTGQPGLLTLKTVLTPLKFGLFLTAAILALVLAIAAFVRWIMRRRGPSR